MSSASIQTLVFIFYSSPVQGRMAGGVEWCVDDCTSIYKFDRVVRGQHISKSAWIPLTDKMCKYILQEDNVYDKYTVHE